MLWKTEERLISSTFTGLPPATVSPFRGGDGYHMIVGKRQTPILRVRSVLLCLLLSMAER